MDNLWTLDNIKSVYDVEIALGIQDQDFETYLRNSFIPVYNKDLSFIGYKEKE